MEEKQFRQEARRDMSQYGWALMIYSFLINICVSGGVTVAMIWLTTSGAPGGEAVAATGYGWGYLVACLMGVGLFRLWKGKETWNCIWREPHPMTWSVFVQLVGLMLFAQLLAQVWFLVLEWICQSFGFSSQEAMSLATEMPDNLTMFLYSALVAPVTEEILFRGGILRGLESYGKGFAIVASGLLFGMFHGNAVQIPYAMAAGMILGYTAMEYGIAWAMVLHMGNNLILGDILPRLTQHWSDGAYSLLFLGLYVLGGCISLVALLRNQDKLWGLFHRGSTRKGAWRSFLTAPGIVGLFLLNLWWAVSMLLV